MAINLHEKYSTKIAERFTHDSFVAGNTSNDYDFDGVKSINITTLKQIPVGTYSRTGASRFGTANEVEDIIQTLTMSQEPSWTATIDKGNASDQQYIKKAAEVIKAQSEEVVVPNSDKYALGVFANKGGQIVEVASLTKSNVVEKIFDGAAALDNALVPTANRIIYMGATVYNLVRLSPEFVGVDALGEKALGKGVVGMIADMKCVKVPDSYLPTNVKFIITHKKSVIMPNKLKTARILDNVAGVDGRVLEYHGYYDAFVIGARANGVYVAVAQNTKVATPTLSGTTLSCTTSGATIVYTVDGTDPRYSNTAVVGTTVVGAGTEPVHAYAYKANMFASDVL